MHLFPCYSPSSQVPGLRPLKKKKKGCTRQKHSRKDPTPAERLKAQLEEKERQLEEARCQLEEKERRLEEQHQLQQQEHCESQHEFTPPQVHWKSAPRQTQEQMEDTPPARKKRPHYQLEEDQDQDFFWNDDVAPMDVDGDDGEAGDGGEDETYGTKKDDAYESDKGDKSESSDEEMIERLRRGARQREIKKATTQQARIFQEQNIRQQDRQAQEQREAEVDRKRREKEQRQAKKVKAAEKVDKKKVM